jgi:F-type H+-transporting ATPase subunit epsilon
MSSTFNVEIISPDKLVYSGPIVSIVVPAESGYLGILANHAPLIARIIKGKISVKEASGDIRTFRVSGEGFIEVMSNKASVLLCS